MPAALLLAACARDPMDDPYYAAECHGPPVRSVEARSEAMQQGYTISTRFDCITKESWDDVQHANELVADMVEQAKREAKSAPPATPLAANLAEAREGFRTAVHAPANGSPLPKPPPELFIRSDYTGGEGRNLAAYVTPDPRDGARHPAIVWLTGGDSSTLDDFWTPGPPQADESASAFRKAGLVMMFPTLRGGNTDEGAREFFYGEVDDVHAAANHLARLPYVDPARIYLGGHSTGGTLALLAAETGGRYAAVFAFGPVSTIDRYPASMLNFDLAALSERERQLRSPQHWLKGISTPTYLIEGREPPSNIGELEALCSNPGNELLFCIAAQGFDHFAVIEGIGRVLAARLATDRRVQGQWLAPAEFTAAAR